MVSDDQWHPSTCEPHDREPLSGSRGEPKESSDVIIAHAPLLIIPAPTVTPVASSIRMKEPVVRFFE